MNVDDADNLRQILLTVVITHEARLQRQDEFGQRYTLDFRDFHSERLCQRDGRTYESVGLRPTQFIVLCFDRSLPRMVSV
jgi:hypothetical protein